MGSVINSTILMKKSKCQVKGLQQKGLFLNEKRLEKVNVYKYLWMNIRYTSCSRVKEIQYLCNVCKVCLRPLRVLAWVMYNGVASQC